MLTDDERSEIEATLPHYPHRRSAAAGAMRIVQRHRGYLSDEALADIGAFLGSVGRRARLAGDLRQHALPPPRRAPRHPDLRQRLLLRHGLRADARPHLPHGWASSLGETTPDGRFTFLPIVCLAQCDHAPAMQVDDDFHGDLTPERIDEILARYE